MDEPNAPQDAPQIEVQNIDHLGIVAGIIDEIALDECCEDIRPTTP
jgi:hypothetical protein